MEKKNGFISDIEKMYLVHYESYPTKLVNIRYSPSFFLYYVTLVRHDVKMATWPLTYRAKFMAWT